MKHVLLIIVFFLLVVPKAFAETSVHIENNGDGASSDVHVDNNVGQSTTCVNGSCSTTNNGNNSTTVCINEKCTTSQDGNVDRQEDGANVHVQNHSNSSSSNSSVHIEKESQPQIYHPVAETLTPIPTHQASHSASFGKTQDKHTKQDQENKYSQTSIEQMIENIRKFFNDLFSSHK